MIKENMQKYLPENARVEFGSNTAIFEVPVSQITKVLSELYADKNLSLKLITATDERKENGCFKIWYIFGAVEEKVFIIPFIKLTGSEEFPSFTPAVHAVWNYERKIQTFFGLTPIDHPDSRPIMLHENWPADVHPLRKDFNCQTRPKTAATPYNFQKVQGEGIYEIPVGPVHAGIIEPGHFRFSVAGEEIVLLEARLGYKHKGIEKLFEILPFAEKLKLAERVSGDSSFSHSLAYCQAVEALGEIKVPERAEYLRVIFAELERLANHFGDLGAMMLDTGFNFGGSHGARLREVIMQWHERLTGSRFLRGVNAIGGVNKDIASEPQAKLSADLEKIKKDFAEVIEIAENSSSVMNRLKGTGKISSEIAVDHGVVGVAGRAVGLIADVRKDFPYAAYGKLKIEPAGESAGDVYARFRVRVKEVYSSLSLIKEALEKLPANKEILSSGTVKLKKQGQAIGLVEGWRGEIIYFVATDQDGNISRVEPRDPSFLNWPAVGHAGKGNIVPDFPLINKSFNLSYSGNDL